MSPTLFAARDHFLAQYATKEKERTKETYEKILRLFFTQADFTDRSPAEDLSADRIMEFLDTTRDLALDTRHLYAATLVSFCGYLDEISCLTFPIPTLRKRIRRSIGTKQTQPVIFAESQIEKLIDCAVRLTEFLPKDEMGRLRLYRNRALILLLADTGLRIREACTLKRGDLDYDNLRIVVLGKGNKRALVRASERAMRAIKDYLTARSMLDGATGKALQTLPVFARHDPRAGRDVKFISPTAGRDIIEKLVKKTIGQEKIGRLSPHTLRHNFVTKVLRSSGNMKIAQSLARHQSIASTQRYAHLADDDLDKAYREAFET